MLNQNFNIWNYYFVILMWNLSIYIFKNLYIISTINIIIYQKNVMVMIIIIFIILFY